MAVITVEMPCDIGDPVYEIIVSKIGKEIYLDSYIVEDISLKSIKYCDNWKDRKTIGNTVFLIKEKAERRFKEMMSSDKYNDYKFFYDDEEIIHKWSDI